MILLTSIPKSGTHLLMPVLEQLLGVTAVVLRKGSGLRIRKRIAASLGPGLVVSHLRVIPRLVMPPQVNSIVLIRDPRDILVSMRDFLIKPERVQDGHQRAGEVLRQMDANEQIRALVIGFKVEGFTIRPLHEHCIGYLEWRQLGAQIVRYEDLHAPVAGQIVADAMLRPDLALRAQAIIERHIGRPSATFHIGRVGRWRTEISPRLQAYIRDRSHGIVEHLGYGWDEPG